MIWRNSENISLWGGRDFQIEYWRWSAGQLNLLRSSKKNSRSWKEFFIANHHIFMGYSYIYFCFRFFWFELSKGKNNILMCTTHVGGDIKFSESGYEFWMGLVVIFESLVSNKFGIEFISLIKLNQFMYIHQNGKKGLRVLFKYCRHCAIWQLSIRWSLIMSIGRDVLYQ